jgi:hypothetical protein
MNDCSITINTKRSRCRYHHEQGLTKRRFTIEDIVVPGLLDT